MNIVKSKNDTFPTFVKICQLIVMISGLLGFFWEFLSFAALGSTTLEAHATNARLLAIPFSILTLVSMTRSWRLSRFIFGIGQSFSWIFATYYTYESFRQTGSSDFPIPQALVAICAVIVTVYFPRSKKNSIQTNTKTG